jgi:hypothetical protein
MPREVTDAQGTNWSCVQAYAGLSETSDRAAERVQQSQNTNDETVTVVCTPSGGAQSVRLQLTLSWESDLSDEEMLQEIEAQQKATPENEKA